MSSATLQVKRYRMMPGLKYFLIAIPFMIFTFMFSYVQLFGWIIAFSDYRLGMRLTHINIIGFEHFEKIVRHSSETIRILRNTLVMSGLGLLTSPVAIVFAILLNELRGRKYKRFVQTTTILPHFISWIVVFGIAFSFFSLNGLVNTVLEQLGLERSRHGLLGDRDNVWFFQLGLAMWKGLGWSAIIYLAAITGIDQDLYEAARVDGAGKLRCVWHITVPGVMPTYFVLLVLAISNILNSGFDQYFVFFNPLVAERIEVLDYYIYKIGILVGDLPYATVLGMLRSLIGVFLLFFANLASKKVRGQSLF